MKSWFNRMKPKFKNWRWWITLLPTLTLLIVVGLSIYAIKGTGSLLSWIGNALDDLVQSKLSWYNEVIKWSEKGDKE